MIIHFDLTLPIQVVLFLVFLALLNRVFYRPMERIVGERDARIAAGLRASEESERRLQEGRRSVESQLAAAREQAQAIIAAANADAGEERRALLDEARHQAEHLLAQAHDDIRRERDAASAELRRAAAPLAILAAEKVVGTPLDTPENRRVVDRALAEVEGVYA